MRSSGPTQHRRRSLAAALLIGAALLLLPQQTQGQTAPTITGDATASVAENTPITSVIKTYTATDADIPAQTFTWSLEGADHDDFTVAGGELKFKVIPDFENPAGSPAMGMTDPDNTYEITVKVTDSGTSPNSATLAVVVTVTDVNEAPEITTMTTAYNFAENTDHSTTNVATFEASDDDMDTLTWTLDGNDKDDFEINANNDGEGVLTFKASPNYEDPKGSPAVMNDPEDNTYEITIQVRDSKDASGTADTAVDDTLAVVVTVTDVNEKPTIDKTTTAYNHAENTLADTAVVIIDATDPDSGHDLTWTLTGDDASKFVVTKDANEDGVLKFMSSPDFENPTDVADSMSMGAADNIYKVTVSVRDSKNDDGTVNNTEVDDSIDLEVTVTNANDAPTFDTTPANFDRDENTETTVVIATYMASDEDDPEQTLTWSLEGDDKDDFSITEKANGDGELKFAAKPNYESPADDNTDNNYEVTIKVTDDGAGTLSATQAITITVNDLNEPPIITSTGTGFTAPSKPEIEFDIADEDLTATAKDVATYSATDPDDGHSLSWTVSGTDAASFSIDNTGKLSFSIRPDYENPADVADDMSMGADDNIYKLVVEVSDGLDDSGAVEDPKVVDDMIDVTVTVTNVDEAPEITTTEAMTHTAPSFVEIEYDVSEEDLASDAKDIATYMARDEEGETITWSVAGTDGDDFSIGETTGLLSFMNRPNYDLPTDREDTTLSYNASDNLYQIIVRATDGTTAPNDVAKTRDLPVTVTVTNVDETPEFTSPPADREFDEIEYDYTGTPDLVVATFTARDEESEDITWTLTGNDAADLTIAENSDGEGVVSFNSAPNFEMPAGTPADAMDPADNTYEITVVITDATDSPNTDANQRTLDYVVTVLDVNERPDITEFLATELDMDGSHPHPEVDYYFDLNENTPDAVHTFMATDYDDGDTFTWTLDGVDKDHLEIDPSTGVLTFKQDPAPNSEPLAPIHRKDEGGGGLSG